MTWFPQQAVTATLRYGATRSVTPEELEVRNNWFHIAWSSLVATGWSPSSFLSVRIPTMATELEKEGRTKFTH